MGSLEDELDVQEEEVGGMIDLQGHWRTRADRFGVRSGRGGYYLKESKVGMYRCPNGYYPTLGGGCASAKNPFKRTPWFFRAEKAVGEWVDRDSDEGAHGASSSAEELEVSGPSRYDPTGRESRVSGPARVDHWDP